MIIVTLPSVFTKTILNELGPVYFDFLAVSIIVGVHTLSKQFTMRINIIKN